MIAYLTETVTKRKREQSSAHLFSPSPLTSVIGILMMQTLDGKR
jgi:hypothetical protein